MKVHLLGTGGYRPTEFRHTACFMLPEEGIVLDMGTGAFRIRELLETDHLDIFLSHAHLDHVVGIAYLLYIKHDRPNLKIRIHGEAAKLRVVQEHLLVQEMMPVALDCQWVPLPAGGELISPSGVQVNWFPLKHPGGSVGYRLWKENHGIGYVTDTTAALDADYVRQIEGVNLLIHECNFPDGREDWAELTGHSCASSVAQVARRVGAEQLVVMHMDPLSDEPVAFDLGPMREIFPNTICGEDGMILEVGS